MMCSVSRSSIADTIKWCPATRFWAVGRSLLEGLCSYTQEVADLGLKNFSPCYCQEVRLIWFASKIGLALYKIRTKTDAEHKKKKVILIRGLEPPTPSLDCLVYAFLQQLFVVDTAYLIQNFIVIRNTLSLEMIPEPELVAVFSFNSLIWPFRTVCSKRWKRTDSEGRKTGGSDICLWSCAPPDGAESGRNSYPGGG